MTTFLLTCFQNSFGHGYSAWFMATLMTYDPLTMSRILSTTKLANKNENVHQSNLQNPAVNQVVWRIRTPKRNLDLIPNSCKYAVNQVVWRIRIPKLSVDLVLKSCKNTQNQVVWRIRIRKVRFPKLILHRGFEAFVYTRLILFLKNQDPQIESSFSPKIMQIRCKPAGLEDKDPKPEPGLNPKIMQIRCKPGGLEDQDPKSKISKINFASWIRGFCRHLSHPFFLGSRSQNWTWI